MHASKDANNTKYAIITTLNITKIIGLIDTEFANDSGNNLVGELPDEGIPVIEFKLTSIVYIY